jgi:hypothetical protein
MYGTSVAIVNSKSVPIVACMSSCWITERGGESVIDMLNPFNHSMQVLFIFMINIELSSNKCRVNKP